MKILVLGGTAWLGRTITEAALAAGHQVTCLARGTQIAPGAQLVRADRQEDGALATLQSGPSGSQTWDTVIDVASEPGFVRQAVRDLAGSAGHYVYISSCNAYGSLADEGIAEDAPLHAPLSGDAMASPAEYGPAKVACEQAVTSGFERRCTIIRPGLIGGPGDPTGRTTYWPLRFQNPSNAEGAVLIPETPTQLTSVIDARDLAAWVVRLSEHRQCGTFNAAGEVIPFAAHIHIAREVSGHQGPLISASSSWLTAHEVEPWMGPRSLPLWLPDPDVRGIASLSNALAKSAGLRLRPLTKTLSDILAWAKTVNAPTVSDAGLTDAEESSLLAAL